MDQIYNIILMEPSGTGKTFVSAGLCAVVVKKDYGAYLRTIDNLLNTFEMRSMAATAKAEYKRFSGAHLIVIDDIMLFPVEKKEAVSLFNSLTVSHDYLMR